MKRGFVYTGIICALSLTLTGCGSLPDLTKDQQDMVSQYAVGLLLKYDSENHSRLVDTDSFWDTYDAAKEQYDKAEEKYYEELNKKASEDKEESESEATGDSENSSEKTGTSSGSDGTGGAMVVDARTIGSLLEMPDFSVDYAGNDVLNAYPEDAEDLMLEITATTGKDLLVVYFNVTNNGSSTENFDILDKEPVFKLSVNGNSYHSVLKTFVLDDDMSLYSGDFNAGETKRLVLITEVDKDTVVSSLGLRVTYNDDTITKSLK